MGGNDPAQQLYSLPGDMAATAMDALTANWGGFMFVLVGMLAVWTGAALIRKAIP